MVYRAGGWNSAVGAWLRKILERRPVRLATVALANKMARIVWAVMTRKEVYRPKGATTAVAHAPACGQPEGCKAAGSTPAVPAGGRESTRRASGARRGHA